MTGIPQPLSSAERRLHTRLLDAHQRLQPWWQQRQADGTAEDLLLPPAPEEFLLRYGRCFTLGRTDRAGACPQQCWRNALRRARQNPERYAYAEGVALYGDSYAHMTIWHGWPVDRSSGEVVEATWPTPGVAYFGYELPVEVVDTWSARTKRARSGTELARGPAVPVTDTLLAACTHEELYRLGLPGLLSLSNA